nr:immunoglobulin lambda-1 light chain-like [Pelodiscus sinensis]|eukprot:XP_025040955.1 immunoglobulin lambda-1 light chain-like [Pelodiscus sinensis]
MLLLQVLIATSAWSYGHAQKSVTQTPISITRQKGKTAVMLCKIPGATINSEYIHWYRQSPGAAPKRILYAQATSVTVDEGIDKGRFEVSTVASEHVSILRMHQLTPEDTAMYYCAVWDPNEFKYFGTGTKLVVSDTKAKLNPQKVQILSPTTQDGNGTYVCLFEDFFPNVINVTWEGPDADKNAIRGEIWPSGDDQNSYSMSSWLTMDDPDQMYNCTYKHESGKDSVPLQSQAPNAPDNQIVPCVNRVENGTTFSTDYDFTESLTHTTAYFVYILLLLKSTMYYVIVLFFMYRMKSSSKRHGKKP